MKHKHIIVIVLCLIPLFVQAQTEESTNRFGFAINSSLNGEVYPLRIVPSLLYIKGNSQLELGYGFHPFVRVDQRINSGEFNYKFFPNGMEKKFNLYLVTQLSYLHNLRKTFYPTTYNYLFLNGGYGFQIQVSKNIYMGTNMSAGVFTYNKRSEIPYTSFSEKNLFDEAGFNLAFQFNLGYRF